MFYCIFTNLTSSERHYKIHKVIFFPRLEMHDKDLLAMQLSRSEGTSQDVFGFKIYVSTQAGIFIVEHCMPLLD